jgi:hypothetical protein
MQATNLSSTSSFYESVMSKVIDSMKNEFVQEGLQEEALEKLKTLWD